MKKNNELLLALMFIVGILVGVGAGYLVFYKSPEEREAAKKKYVGPTPVVTYIEAVQGQLPERILSTGQLKALNAISVKVEVDGTIEKIHFLGGDIVQKGDAILQINDELYKAKRDQAKADLDFKQALYDKEIKLGKLPGGKTAAKIVDLEKAEAERDIAEARLREAQLQLDKTTVRAKFDGVLGLKNVSEGALVRAGDEIMTLEQTIPLQVEFRISERDMKNHNVKLDQKVEIIINEDLHKGRPIRSTISELDPKFDPVTHSVLARAIVQNVGQKFKSGQFAQVSVITGRGREAVIIPDIAVVRSQQNYFIWVLDNDNHPRPMSVLIGRQDGDNIEIVSKNLLPGMRVIVSNEQRFQGFLSENKPVLVERKDYKVD